MDYPNLMQLLTKKDWEEIEMEAANRDEDKAEMSEDELEEAADAGDPDAQWQLGMTLLNSENEDESNRGFELIASAANNGKTDAAAFYGAQLIAGEYDVENVCMGLSYLHGAANEGNLWAKKCLDKFYELAPDENYTAEADDEEEAFGDFYVCENGTYIKIATIGDILNNNWEDGRPRLVVGSMQIVNEWMTEGESVKVDVEKGEGVVGDLITVRTEPWVRVKRLLKVINHKIAEMYPDLGRVEGQPFLQPNGMVRRHVSMYLSPDREDSETFVPMLQPMLLPGTKLEYDLMTLSVETGSEEQITIEEKGDNELAIICPENTDFFQPQTQSNLAFICLNSLLGVAQRVLPLFFKEMYRKFDFADVVCRVSTDDEISLVFDNETRVMTVKASFLTLFFLKSSLQCYCAPSDEWASATVSLSPDWEKGSLILVDPRFTGN